MDYKILYDKEKLEQQMNKLDLEFRSSKMSTIIKYSLTLIIAVGIFAIFHISKVPLPMFLLGGVLIGYLSDKTSKSSKSSHYNYNSKSSSISWLNAMLEHKILSVVSLEDDIVSVTIDTSKVSYSPDDSINIMSGTIFTFKCDKIVHETESPTPTRVDFYCDEIVLIF